MATVQTVGIREAKAHLSRYLHSVRQGNEIILTDRNRPVGKIVPISAEALSLAERLRSLEEKGLIQSEKAAVERNPTPVPLLPLGLAQALLQEDRNK